MVFSSLVFLYIFLPIVLIAHLVCPQKYRNVLLLISSLLFYAWGEPIYVILMLFVIIFNWAIGKVICNNKLLLAVAITVNLLALFFFKYANFVIANYNMLFHRNLKSLEVSLPIGISFFTFQAISYIVDLYRGKYGPQKSLVKLALYISFFPQLIAGPIVRYVDIDKQFDNRNVTSIKAAEGIRRFIIGLSKKVLIANVLGRSVDEAMTHPIVELSTMICWITALMYLMQIYFDFSGYSDMAIGLGKIFGFNFYENFNMPYISKSINEFWRRWHISLGTWFREYLYIPLGGNRNGIYRTIVNLMIVFAATGIWHGASWNFLIWGLWHGLLCVVERIGFKSFLERHKIFSHGYTVFAVMIGFVIFRIDNLSYLIGYLKKMFLPWVSYKGCYSFFEMANHETIFILIIAVVLSGPILLLGKWGKVFYQRHKYGLIDMILCGCLFVVCIMQLTGGTYNPFIYFRF